MGGGKGGGQTTTVQKSDPWAKQQPFLEYAFPQAKGLYESGKLTPKAYDGQTVAGFAPETKLAQNLTTQRALSGSPITNTANDYLQKELQGNYLNSNPYLDKTFDTAANKVQGRVNSAFGGGGRFGGGLNQKVLGDSLGELATSIYGGNYQDERNRMQQGLLFAPQAANQDYYDINQLAGVGGQKEGMQQNLINQDINKFNLNQQAPLNALQSYNSLIQGNYGGTNTTTQPYYQNNAGNAIGTGLLGASAASSLLPSSFNLGALLTAGLPWSDVRKKEDITYVGMENGHEIFNFRYTEYPELGYFRGVMAQKVMEKNPEAVVMGEDGFYRVDYDKLGVEFKQLPN